MADVNYLGFAEAMGARNPIADGLSQLGKTLDQQQAFAMQKQAQDRQNTLADLQIRQGENSLADTAAKQGAIQSVYGVDNPQDAYTAQMKAEMAQKQLEADQKGLDVFGKTMELLHKTGASPETITKFGKAALQQNPRYAGFADNLTFLDSKGVKGTRQYAEGELKDPATGQPLPAGYYETEGKWTGKADKPVELTSYKLIAPPQIKEGAAIPDGEGGWTVPNPKDTKNQLKEIPSPDGKTAQLYSIDPSTGDKIAVGTPYKVKSQVTNINVQTKPSMTSDAVDMAAQQYLLTGQMPALGMGGAAQKMMILDKAAKMAKEQGIDARGIQGQISGLKADAGALKNDEKQYDMMHKSELQAQGAAKLLRASSAEYGRTNIKFVNSIAALAREAVNDPKLADLQMKLLAFGREYYKVTTNAYASAAELSIGAQAAADKMLNSSNSYAALEAKVNAAEQEMSNTNKTFLQTISERKAKITGTGNAQPKQSGRFIVEAL